MPKDATQPALEDLDQQEPEVTEKPILYDAREPQRIGITVKKNGRKYDLFHNLSPVSDRRFFDLQAEIESQSHQSRQVTSDSLFGPKHKAWKDLATGREGYAERDDWKDKTHPTDCVQAINVLFEISVQDVVDTDEEPLFDDDALVVIPFHTMFNSSLLTGMSHSFRTESKAEMDTFMSIENGDTNPNALASAEKLSQAEKLARLGRKILQQSDGYAPGSPVPAWHLAGTTRAFFLRQFSRLGKF